MKGKTISIAIILLTLNFFFIGTTFAETVTVINTQVANIYKNPDENSGVVSQAIYGANVNVLQSKNNWALVTTDDDYQGWVERKDLGQIKKAHGADITVNSLFACIYREPDTMLHPPLFLVPFGTKLIKISVPDDRWIKVRLVGNDVGWIQQGDVLQNVKSLSMSEMLNLSPRFVGLPYRWAGTSTYGFDCSGFVQFLYRQIGIILPRDGDLQVTWPRFIEVSKENLEPGDVIYFGWDNVISHAGVYLGDNKFINSTVYKNPSVQISDLRLPHWQDIFITARRLDPTWPKMPSFKSSVEPISEKMQADMQKYTWHSGCPVAISDLSHVKLSYWGFDNHVHEGALIVNRKIAAEVVTIFHELYLQRFPINKMQPIENYQGDDHESMRDNNTSAFNCRAMVGFPDKYSIHSYGTAIDINPLINPYVNGNSIEPKEGAEYQDRQAYHKGKINLNSPAYKAFTKHGWIWGGAWPDRIKIKDYQHFEKYLQPHM